MTVSDTTTDDAEPCLHCHVMQQIIEWNAGHQRDDGPVVIDCFAAIQDLAQCIVEIASMGDASDRQRAMQFAHEALDGLRETMETGKLVPLKIPHAGH